MLEQIQIEEQVNIKELFNKGKQWFYYLKSKWLILILAGIVGGVIGFFYAYSKKPIYTATLSFALEDEKSGGGLGGALGLASQFGFDLGVSAGGAFSGANLVELMKSRRIVEQTLLDPVTVNGQQISLAEMYIQNNELRQAWNEKPELKEIKFLPNSDRTKYTLKQDSLLGLIYDDIIANRLGVGQKDKKISIITIDVKGENELFCKYFTETLAKEVSDFYIDTKSRKSKMNVAILERQADSIRAELNSAITGVAVATDNTFNLNPALNVKRTVSSRRQVDVQANTAILTQLVTNLELARVSLRKETPLIQTIDTPILPLKKEKVSKLKSMLGGGFLAGFIVLGMIVLRRIVMPFLKD